MKTKKKTPPWQEGPSTGTDWYWTLLSQPAYIIRISRPLSNSLKHLVHLRGRALELENRHRCIRLSLETTILEKLEAHDDEQKH